MLTSTYIVPLLTLLTAPIHAIPQLHKRASGVTSSPDTANGQTFDYIVVGAGLTGTTVAARIAEDSSVTILLVEAGGDNRTNPQVYDIYAYSQAFGGPMDWAWSTDQGKVIRGSVIIVTSVVLTPLTMLPCRGKTLGGSSSINGGHWTRGLNAQYDAWSALLEPSETSVGWNWTNLWSYMKKVRIHSLSP